MLDASAESARLLHNALKGDPSAKGLGIHFKYRFITFEWTALMKTFEPIRFDCCMPYDKLRQTFTSQTRFGNEALRSIQRMKFGSCQVDVPKKSVMGILVSEVLNPFYIFQVFSVILWFWDYYYYYAGCILIISTASVVASLVETISNHNSIREMARYQCRVKLVGAGQSLHEVDSTELVPGDVIQVPEGLNLPCDLVLLTGSAIVNEAMLTGESIPVMKSCLPVVSSLVYREKGTEKHTLFGGTSVI